MDLKYLFFVAAWLLSIEGLAQVTLQTGSAEVSIPIYSYKDNISALSLGLSLDYSSGSGLIVDKLSGPIGNDWDLIGVPSITRIQKGLPDDQNGYGKGMCFNAEPITSGCPNILNYYPIFPDQNIDYDDP